MFLKPHWCGEERHEPAWRVLKLAWGGGGGVKPALVCKGGLELVNLEVSWSGAIIEWICNTAI